MVYFRVRQKRRFALVQDVHLSCTFKGTTTYHHENHARDFGEIVRRMPPFPLSTPFLWISTELKNVLGTYFPPSRVCSCRLRPLKNVTVTACHRLLASGLVTSNLDLKKGMNFFHVVSPSLAFGLDKKGDAAFSPSRALYMMHVCRMHK